MNEVWKDIKGFEGEYQISNLGRVKSLGRIIVKPNKYGVEQEFKWKEKIMSACDNGRGYMSVYFKRNGKRLYVHRLVAQHFLSNEFNYKEVNHIDNNTKNNNVDNLEWIDRQGNKEHSIKQGRHARGMVNGNSKLTDADVKEIKYLVKTNIPQWKIGEMFGVKQSIISAIKLGKKWKHIE